MSPPVIPIETEGRSYGALSRMLQREDLALPELKLCVARLVEPYILAALWDDQSEYERLVGPCAAACLGVASAPASRAWSGRSESATAPGASGESSERWRRRPTSSTNGGSTDPTGSTSRRRKWHGTSAGLPPSGSRRAAGEPGLRLVERAERGAPEKAAPRLPGSVVELLRDEPFMGCLVPRVGNGEPWSDFAREWDGPGYAIHWKKGCAARRQGWVMEWE